MVNNREKMEQAKSFIQQKRYDEARSILHTVNHPLAEEWLEKIDKLDPPHASWEIVPPSHSATLPALQPLESTPEPDYSTAAVIVLVLYLVMWLPGVIANISYLNAARRAEKAAGHKLPGVGALKVERFIFMWLPIILLLAYLVFGIGSMFILNSRFGG